MFSDFLLEIITDELIITSNQLKKLPEIKSVQIFGDKIHVTTNKADQVIKAIKANFPDVRSIQKIEPGIEDTFIELMQR